MMRAASSKGAADLIVLWPPDAMTCLGRRGQDGPVEIPEVWLVQCKRDGRLPKVEREELLRIAAGTGAIPVLARVPKSGRGVEFVNLNTQEEL